MKIFFLYSSSVYSCHLFLISSVYFVTEENINYVQLNEFLQKKYSMFRKWNTVNFLEEIILFTPLPYNKLLFLTP